MKRKLTAAVVAAVTAAQLIVLPQAAVHAEVVTNEKHSGNASAFFSWKGGKDYYQTRQYIGVKPNTRYRYSAWVKAKRANGTFMSISWGTRMSVPTIGTSSDWQYYEMYWDSKDRNQAEVQFTLDGTVEGIWLDDVEFYELDDDGNPVGENLYSNPGFEDGISAAGGSGDAEKPSSAVGDKYEKLHDELMTKSEISIDEFNDVMSLEKHVPALYTENRPVDADMSKWENEASYQLPRSDAQLYTFDNFVYGGEEDLSGEFRFSYDYNYLYMIAKVKDDVHRIVDDATYWQEDCLQLAFGQNTSGYGYEFGFNYDIENDKVNCYSTSVSGDKLSKIKTAAKADGDTIIYEAAIPWEITFERFNDSVPIMICAAINDNDIGKRKQALQMAPGLIEGKVNKDFLVLDFLGDNKDWYAWISGDVNSYLNEENKYSLMIANCGDDKTFKVDRTGSEVTVKKGTIVKTDFTYTAEKKGKTNMDVKIETGGNIYNIPLETDAARAPRSAEELEAARQRVINEYIPELNKLLEECKKQNIPTDYEMVDYATIERFAEYAADDMAHGEEERANYVLDCLDELYESAKAALSGYLDGSKKYHVAQRYQTSKIDIDGTTVWADMRNSLTGEVTRRPFIGTGYGNFSQACRDIPNFGKFGVTNIQNESGPLMVFFSKDYVADWEILNSGFDCDFTQTLDEKHNGAASLKVHSDDTQGANKYRYLYQSYDVKPNTTYEYGVSVKAKNAKTMWISVDGWNTPRKYLSGTYDWTDFKYEHTTGADTTKMTFFIFFEDEIEEAYFDDLFVREVGDSTNLVKNGDFEYGANLEYIDEIDAKYDPTAFFEIVNALERSEENNVTYNVLTSFHYMPGFLGDDNDMRDASGHFMPWNIKSEKLRKVCRVYLEKLIELIKDYKSLNSICLLNEPAYCCDQDVFLPDYREFLKNRYGTIEALNKCYSSNYNSFDEITFKEVKMKSADSWVNFGLDLSEQEKRPQFYDFIQFNDETVMEFFNYLADTVHELAPDIPVHFKTLGDYFGLDSNYNREGMRRGVDFELLKDNIQYNGCDNHAYVDDSDGVNILTKIRANDYMTSIFDAPVYNTEDHVIRDSNKDYTPEQRTWWCANAWECALHGGTMTVSWVWERSWSDGALKGSILERPDIVASYGKIALDMNRMSYEFDAITNRDSYVAVLDSEGARNESKSFVNTSFAAWKAGIMSGQKVQYVTEKMAADGKLNDYKLLLIPEVNRLTEDALKAVETFLANGGRVIILGEDSLKRNEYGFAYDESRIKAIYDKSAVLPISTSGTKLVEPSGDVLRNTVWNETEKLGLNKVKIVDNSTGELVRDVEWAYEYLDGKLVMSMMSFDWNTTKNVSVYVDGVKIESFEELRSEETYNGNIDLKPYEPVMLRI